MKTLGSIHVFESSERDHEKPFFPDRIVISCSFVPQPEAVWPGDARMIEYCHRKGEALERIGLLTEEARAAARDLMRHVELAVEFTDLATAEHAFTLAIQAGIVDIYLYDHGVIHQKHD